MSQSFSTLPLRRIAFWGFLLNMIWEFGQCFFLYDMRGMGFWRATVWMWGAIFGDVLIVLGIVFAAALLVGATHLKPLDGKGWAALLCAGFIASVLLEWAAQMLGLWDYSNLMPTLTLFGYTVGLSPIIQVTTLPAASIFFAGLKQS